MEIYFDFPGLIRSYVERLKPKISRLTVWVNQVRSCFHLARKKISAVDHAYTLILNKILAFELLPGETVSDFQLSQQLNMSRTPIREAIMRLKMMGLIEQGEFRMVVSLITPKDIKEICEVREAIEAKAISLIFNNGGLTRSQLTNLYSLNREMEEYVHINNYSFNFDTDHKLHNSIITYSGNSRLVEYSDRMWLQFKRMRWLTILKPRYNDSIAEHQEIIDAMAESNLSRALNATTLHLVNAMKNFDAVLNDQALTSLAKRIADATLSLTLHDQISKAGVSVAMKKNGDRKI
jgi:DNA-binding GntR family transcriptional regulator